MSVTFRENYKEAQEAFLNQFNRGIISPDAVEVFEIAAPKGFERYDVINDEQKKVEKYFQGITNRLLNSEFAQTYLLERQPVPEFRFFIQDKQSKNAAIYPKSIPPAVFITKGLIEAIVSDGREDLFAGVLAHELTHYFIEKHTERDGNSKIEEGFGDALPTFLLYYSGYQYTGLKDLSKLLGRDGERLSGKAFAYFDVHPSPPLRERIIDDSQAYLAQVLRRKQKGFNGIPLAIATPVPKEEISKIVTEFEQSDVIRSALKNAGFETHVYSYGEKEKEAPEVTVQKINFITSNIDEWLDMDEKVLGTVGRNHRVKELNEVIRNCFGDHSGIQIEPEDMVPLIDKILFSGIPIRLSDIHANYETVRLNGMDNRYATSLTGTTLNLPPLTGQLAEIEDAYTNFSNLFSTTHEFELASAIDKAEALTSAITAIHPEHWYTIRHDFYFGIPPELPSFGYLKGEVYDVWKKRKEARATGQEEPQGLTPPWENLTLAALREFEEIGTTKVAQALGVMGVQDPRLIHFKAYGLEDGRGRNFAFLDLGYPTLILDANGKIIGAYSFLKNEFEHDKLDVNSDYKRPSSTDDKLKINRELIRKTEIARAQEIATLEPSIQQQISSIRSVGELRTLIENNPLFFAIPIHLMGGAVDNKTGLPIGSHSAETLLVKLDELAKENPSEWHPVLKQLFGSQTNKAEEALGNDNQYISFHDLIHQLRRNWLDHAISGQHDHFMNHDEDSPLHKDGKVLLYMPDEMGMSSKHPYVQYALKHTRGLPDNPSDEIFSIAETLSVLDRVAVAYVKTFEGQPLSPPQVQMTDVYFKLIGADGFSTNADELAERLLRLRHIHPSVALYRGYDHKQINPDDWQSVFGLLHARNEAYQFLTKNTGQPISPVAFEEIYLALQASVGDNDGAKTGTAFVDELKKGLETQFAINANFDLSAERHDPQILAKAYALYEKTGFFQKNPSIRWGDKENRGYDSLILNELTTLSASAISHPQELQKFAEEILYNCYVQSPSLRQKLVDGWATAIGIQYGIDQTPAFAKINEHPEFSAYYAQVSNVVDQICEMTSDNGLLHQLMIDGLADSLETQSGLTQLIYRKSEQHTKNQAFKNTNHSKGPLAEVGLDVIVSQEKTRLQTIELLTSPLSDEAIEKYISTLAARQEKSEHYGMDMERWTQKFIENPIDTAIGATKEKADLNDPEIRKQTAGKLRAAYENFWASPLVVRGCYMSLIAFPETRGIRKEDRTPEFDELMAYVMDRVLPYDYTDAPESPDTPTAFKDREIFGRAGLRDDFRSAALWGRYVPVEKPKKVERPYKDTSFNRHTSYGRDLITSYLNKSSEAEKRLILSAMMVSARHLGENGERSEEQIGRALALVLQNMGPAGVKLAQAIHSLPDTPQAIRNGMEGVKGEANKPNRKTFLERTELVVPTELDANQVGNKLSQTGIKHIKGLLGSGSYQFTLDAELYRSINGYPEVAVTILRDHVLTFAENEFVHFKNTIDNFVTRRKAAGDAFSPQTINALNQVIKQASGMASIETNYEIGRTQAELMKDRYNGMVIQVGSSKIAFTTVEWLDERVEHVRDSYGEDIQAYKVANIAPGQSFNKWASVASNDEVITVAPALQCAEDILMLSGQHFDHDRHGDNFHVLVLDEPTKMNGITLNKGDVFITGYDFGAVNLTPPTKDEKIAIGNVIAKSMADVKAEKDVRVAIVDNLSAAITRNVSEAEDNTGGDYLSATLRGLLARGDFLRFLDAKTMNDAAIAAVQAGIVDEDVFQSASSSLNVGTGFIIKTMGKTASELLGSTFLPQRFKQAETTIKVLALPDALKPLQHSLNPLMAGLMRLDVLRFATRPLASDLSNESLSDEPPPPR